MIMAFRDGYQGWLIKIALFLFIVLLIGCSATPTAPADQELATEEAIAEEGTERSASAARAEEGVIAEEEEGQEYTGKLSVEHKETDYTQAAELIKNSQVLEFLTESINEFLLLPQDLPTILEDCDEQNAFYSPETKSITICYEIVDDIYNVFEQDGYQGEELEKQTIDATVFIFYHELGHALIDLLDLPTTGKEEDSVDQLATIMLTTADDDQAALDGAYYFLLLGQASEGEELALWDEHSLDQQRFYNIACWVYGKDAEAHSYLIEEGFLPEERGQSCESEYDKVYDSWARLLEPYIVDAEEDDA
ncbi:DUF4344 domain-containing metallopeptidase [Candidatus Woesearchaeota archaeon]|nr:DUF4344 domain-containing metallopeptidase [Candidatus Woesearchaeota archaeon]